MGQAGLAEQTRSAMAQRWSVRRRAVVATKKTGGRNVPGPALRRANAREETRIYVDRRDHARARHRREHGDFQRRQRRVAALAALSKGGRIGGGLFNKY